MKKEETELQVKEYINKIYGSMEITELDYKNQCFDAFAWGRNIHVKIEYKRRYFKDILYDDILVELVQSTFDMKKYFNMLSNGNINQLLKADMVNTYIGWFYKCSADRLYYIRYLNNFVYDMFDIDYTLFKPWILNNMDKFKQLQFSNKSTGTINLVVKLSDIPKNIITNIKLNNLTTNKAVA